MAKISKLKAAGLDKKVSRFLKLKMNKKLKGISVKTPKFLKNKGQKPFNLAKYTKIKIPKSKKAKILKRAIKKRKHKILI